MQKATAPVLLVGEVTEDLLLRSKVVLFPTAGLIPWSVDEEEGDITSVLNIYNYDWHCNLIKNTLMNQRRQQDYGYLLSAIRGAGLPTTHHPILSSKIFQLRPHKAAEAQPRPRFRQQTHGFTTQIVGVGIKLQQLLLAQTSEIENTRHQS